MMAKPTLLNDDQVRSFIVNGMLVLKADVAQSTNSEINSQLNYSSQNETWLGNNLPSRIPLMHEVLRSPAINGALISLAGSNYYLHPHRALHRSTPVEEAQENLSAEINAPKMGKNSTAGSGWHQDAQSPLARARHHLPKYLIGFYFPHDTPRAMGPTRLIPGSYLDAEPTEIKDVFLPDFVEAGTFIIVHFDMVHAGYPNQSELDRNMVKFVFARTETPTSPSWDFKDARWTQPQNTMVSKDRTPAWTYIWNWLLGASSIEVSSPKYFNDSGKSDSSSRVANIYSEVNSGDIDALASDLIAKQGAQKHERLLIEDRDNNPIPRDDVRDYPIRWNERAVVMEDEAYRLAAIGQNAIETLTSILSSTDPWLQINAAFAIGEIGEYPRATLLILIKLLDSPHQQVVRQALDALAFKTKDFDEPCFKTIENVITKEVEDWQIPLVQRGWTGQDQVRLNASFLLLNAAIHSNLLDETERLLRLLLKDSNGYAAAVAAEGLIRLKSPTSVPAAIQYLQDRRWDESIKGNVKAF